MDEKNALHTPEALSRLPREELQRQLSAQLHKDASEIDTALVVLLRKELASREPDMTLTDDTAILSACEKFRQDTQAARKSRCRYASRLITAASAVLVLGILFFALPATAQARDIRGVLAWWSDSAFHFFTPGKASNPHSHEQEIAHPDLYQIYEAVTELGITDPVVPCWIPDGFTLVDLNTTEISAETYVVSYLENPKNHIIFTISIHKTSTSFQHEKDEKAVTVWEFAGNTHYMLSNNTNYTVTWIKDNIECTLVTDCPEEDVYRIVKSIYTSEA